MTDGAFGGAARAHVSALDVHGLPVAVLALVDGNLVQANEHWSALTGLSESDSLGREWLAAVHVDDRAAITLDARADGVVSGGQIRLSNVRNTTEVWVQPRVRTVGAAGRPVVVVTMTEIGTLKASEADLRYRATHDPMTGLLNKASFLDAVEQALVATPDNDGAAVVLFVDLDGFKAVNDQHGHAVGDRLLIAAADRLRATARSNDLVGRLGGDEFAVFEAMVPAGGGGQIAARLATALSAPYAFDGLSVRITASVGEASVIGDERAPAIVDRADRAMYRAKAIPGASWSVDGHSHVDGVATDEPPAGSIGGPTADDPGDDEMAPWDRAASTSAPGEWDDEDPWDDDDEPGMGAPRFRNVTVAVVAVLAIVLFGWVAHAWFGGSSARRATAESDVAARPVISDPMATATSTTVPAASASAVSVAATSDPSLERAESPRVDTPTESVPATGTTAPSPATAAGSHDRDMPAAPSGATSPLAAGASVAAPPLVGGAISPDPTATATTVLVPAPGPSATVLARDVAVAAAAPTSPSTSLVAASPTSPAPTSSPPVTPVVTTTTVNPPVVSSVAPSDPALRHVVASNEGPDQIARWFDSIGQGRLFGHSNELHQALPPGTTITVVNGAVTVQRP